MEAKFLATLNHPNVINLCGVSRSGPFQEGFFIVLEKMEETLTKRIKKWMDVERLCKGVMGIFVRSKKKRRKVKTQQFLFVYKVDQRVNHLHEKNIIHRDLKADNIGFNSCGCLKMFDFELAKVLCGSEKLKDGTYKLTGFTRAPCYMAPEVGLRKPYNLKADVYPWSMLFWYMLSLEPPFGLYNQPMIQEEVFLKDQQPKIFSRWSTQESELIAQCWSADSKSRPTMEEVANIVHAELSELDLKLANSSESSPVHRTIRREHKQLNS